MTETPLPLLLLILAMSLPSFAQTTYTQSGPITCQVATLNCHVPLVGGGQYYFLGNPPNAVSNLSLEPADPPMNAYTITGNPNDYVKTVAMPDRFVAGEQPLQIEYQVTDPNTGISYTGTVNGTGHWEKPGRWYYLHIDSSTVRVN